MPISVRAERIFWNALYCADGCRCVFGNAADRDGIERRRDRCHFLTDLIGISVSVIFHFRRLAYPKRKIGGDSHSLYQSAVLFAVVFTAVFQYSAAISRHCRDRLSVDCLFRKLSGYVRYF